MEAVDLFRVLGSMMDLTENDIIATLERAVKADPESEYGAFVVRARKMYSAHGMLPRSLSEKLRSLYERATRQGCCSQVDGEGVCVWRSVRTAPITPKKCDHVGKQLTCPGYTEEAKP